MWIYNKTTQTSKLWDEYYVIVIQPTWELPCRLQRTGIAFESGVRRETERPLSRLLLKTENISRRGL